MYVLKSAIWNLRFLCPRGPLLTAYSSMLYCHEWPRRGVRVAEGARLESVFTRNRDVGSNPTLSATYPSENQSHREHVFGLYGNCTVQDGIAPPRSPDVSFHLLLPLSHPRRVVALGEVWESHALMRPSPRKKLAQSLLKRLSPRTWRFFRPRPAIIRRRL